MSLTRLLGQKGHPVRRWFEERLPNLRTMQATCRVGPARILAPSGVALGTAGTAFDYRLRYYLGIAPTASLVAAKGARRLARAGDRPEAIETFDGVAALTTSLVEDLRPVGRLLRPGDDAQLCRLCYVLAWFDECFRPGLRAGSPLCGLLGEEAEALIAAVPGPAVDDLVALSRAFFSSQQKLIEQRNTAVLNPTFAGSAFVGGADADLVVNRCLIDSKTTKKIGLDRQVAYQLLGYALLDFTDQYRIESVALYFARIPALVQWQLADVLSIAAGADVGVDKLREEFRAVVMAARSGPTQVTLRVPVNGKPRYAPRLRSFS